MFFSSVTYRLQHVSFDYFCHVSMWRFGDDSQQKKENIAFFLLLLLYASYVKLCKIKYRSFWYNVISPNRLICPHHTSRYNPSIHIGCRAYLKPSVRYEYLKIIPGVLWKMSYNKLLISHPIFHSNKYVLDS